MSQHHANQEQRLQTSKTGSHGQQRHEIEVDSVEELIQIDRANTELPPSIEDRLRDAIPQQNLSSEPWWKRFFGRKSIDSE